MVCALVIITSAGNGLSIIYMVCDTGSEDIFHVTDY